MLSMSIGFPHIMQFPLDMISWSKSAMLSHLMQDLGYFNLGNYIFK